MMKRDLLVMLIVVLMLVISSCKVHHIYFVRHAEKAGAMQKDPPLTEAGMQRAGELSSMLDKKKIKAVYSTQTIRTIHTAKPLADKLNLPVQLYKPDTVANLLTNLKAGMKNSLVVGHSNTVLPMLVMTGVKPEKNEIPDWEYDNLFRVTFIHRSHNDVSVRLKALKFGQPSKPL
jgi:phosphohistidine phosphatase SixA